MASNYRCHECGKIWLGCRSTAPDVLTACNGVIAGNPEHKWKEIEEVVVKDIKYVLLADLREAAAQFRKYEELHRAKGTEDSLAKAEVNNELATRFEVTIKEAEEQLSWISGGA